MKTIAIANLQGGSGKTLTAYALSYGLAKRGYKVLAVDADWEEALSKMCGVGHVSKERSLSQLLKQGEEAKTAVLHTADGFSLIPGHISMFEERRDYENTALREALSVYDKDFDYCIIDAPCYNGPWLESILTASQKLIIPTKVVYAVLIDMFFELVDAARAGDNPSLTVDGFLLTFTNPESEAYEEIKKELQQTADRSNACVYKSEIRRDITIPFAESKGQNVFVSYPDTDAVKDYTAFVEEFISKEEN